MPTRNQALTESLALVRAITPFHRPLDQAVTQAVPAAAFDAVVPALVLLAGNGVKNVCVGVMNAAALVFVLIAPIAWLPALLLMAGPLLGGQVGARVARRGPRAPARLRGGHRPDRRHCAHPPVLDVTGAPCERAVTYGGRACHGPEITPNRREMRRGIGHSRRLPA
ncbi:hypothetical protein [Streptomyces sp. NPDC003077]|uniref:hypothetical protein n=1 Tax=Streptomyces sp. NPDC003077 TaxID=3154443 RepID=UPI0033BD0E6A